jgi:hypothetical protein
MSFTQSEICQRIKAALPARWFGNDTPNLDSVLGSFAAGWLGIFDFLDYTRAQARIATAFDGWLDLIAWDYFQFRVKRRLRETDSSFRTRILEAIQRDRCTRSAIYDLVEDLTGTPPIIFEPTNPGDTGCFGSLESPETGVAGYGSAGAWGTLQLPFQVFVTAFRPVTGGVAMVNGWGGSIGGFGVGLSSYISLGMNTVQFSDSEFYNDICHTAPAGTIIWVSIVP